MASTPHHLPLPHKVLLERCLCLYVRFKGSNLNSQAASLWCWQPSQPRHNRHPIQQQPLEENPFKQHTRPFQTSRLMSSQSTLDQLQPRTTRLMSLQNTLAQPSPPLQPTHILSKQLRRSIIGLDTGSTRLKHISNQKYVGEIWSIPKYVFTK